MTLRFGPPQPEVVATFETDSTLGLNFLRNSANPLNLAKIGEGQAAKLPQLKEDLLLTHVNSTCVAGVDPPYDGALALIRDAGRPMTLTFTPLPPDTQPKPKKTDDDGVLNLEPITLAVSDEDLPRLHEGYLEKNRPKGLHLIWQARYFVLTADMLSYYENVEVATQYGSFQGKTQGDVVKRGEIPIATIRDISTPDDKTMVIATVDAPGHSSASPVVETAETPREPYKLRSDSSDVISQWVYKIKQACEKKAAQSAKDGLKVSWSNCDAAMEQLTQEGASHSQGDRNHRSHALASEWTPSPRSAGTPASTSSGGFTPAGGGSSGDDDSGSVVVDDGEANGARLRTMALNGALPVLRGLVANISSKPGGGTEVLNDPGTDGQTALHIAAQHGHEKVVAVLLDAGAAVNVVNAVTGRTPLHVSCVAGHALCVTQLLKAGADETLTDKRGRTALEAARRAKQQAVASLTDWSAQAVAAANSTVSPARRTSPRASASPKERLEKRPSEDAAAAALSPTAGAAASRLARLEALSAKAAGPAPAPAPAEEADEEEI